MNTKQDMQYSDCPNSDYQVYKTRKELKRIKEISLNRLKEHYKTLVENKEPAYFIERSEKYRAVRAFCLDTQLLDFNTIEVMESEVKSSF